MKGGLAQVAALAALLAGCSTVSAQSPAPGEIVSLDLAAIPERRAELDGRWVEFQAYVFLQARGDLLTPLAGSEERSSDGTVRMMCRGTPETNFVIFPRRGFGPLRRRDVSPFRNRQPQVRVRAIFHNAERSVQDHWLLTNFPGYLDNATIVELTGRWCELS